MKRKIDPMSKYMALLVLILFIVNTVLGILLTYQSATAMKSQINSRMLDISNTAASMIDGNALRTVTPDDRGAPEYEQIMSTLREFSENIELEYIYCIRDDGDKHFSFGLDPTLNNPGVFGEPVTYTDALYRASRGMPAVDEAPYKDDWGEFYSSYSPVFDSSGRVAGIVAVDFSKQYYDAKVAPMIWTTVITTASSLLAAAVLVMTLTSRYRQRIRMVNGQLNDLADNFEKLMHEVRNMSGVNVTEAGSAAQTGSVRYDGDDDIESMRMKILALRDELHLQIEEVKAQAYLDGMTGVLNKTSYLQTEKHINEAIKEGTAAFSVIVLDMNGLKSINDDLGHEYGDMAIIDATKALTSVFDKSEIYRIGGDEFIVILNTISEDEIKSSIARLEYRIAQDNVNEKPYKKPLSISMGYSIYDRNADKDYKEVFHRADKCMYEDKAAYYMKKGDRRRR